MHRLSALKKSIIESHIASQKHRRGKEHLLRREKQERTIAEALQAFDKTDHPVGENLPVAVRVHRVKVVKALLRAGVPLTKADCFRELLEEDSRALTSASNLRQLLPFLLYEETCKIQ